MWLYIKITTVKICIKKIREDEICKPTLNTTSEIEK